MRPPSRAARSRLAWVLLALGVLGSLAQPLLPRAAASVENLVVAALAVTSSVIGAALYRGSRREIWVVIAVGQAMSLIGEVIWTVNEDVLHISPFPSVADIAYLAFYPLVALGLVWLVRARKRGRERASLVDAAIITTGTTVLTTVFVVLPAVRAEGDAPLAQVIAAAYPIGDLVLFALLVRLLTNGAARNIAFWSLVVGLATMLVSDTAFVFSVARDLPYPSVFNVGWLLAWALVGFAAVHPSVETLPKPSVGPPEQMTPLRLAALGVALALAPLTYAIQHLIGLNVGTLVVLFGSLVSIGLVLARMWGLLAELQGRAADLAAVAREDALTGVANRRTWDEELARACAAHRTNGQAPAIAVLDIDHFTDFNDLHGHVAGDLVLRQTAKAWSERLGAHGFLARVGGETFAVLLPDLRSKGAEPILDELRMSVARGQTCSIGLAEVHPGESPDSASARADEALLHAKRRGRNRMAAHDGTTVRDLVGGARRPLRTSLQTVYQAIIDLDTGKAVAYEALNRFQESRNAREVFDDGASQDADPALEALALSHAVVAWTRSEPLALNLSGAALLSDHTLQALPDDLSGIIIEIADRDFDEGRPDLLPILTRLRARGARVAVDDVRREVSAVERIVRLRPDIVKCDLPLVRGLHTEIRNQTLVRALVAYATTSGSTVCAEGVETEEECNALRALGVSLAQGFLFGRPGPMPDSWAPTESATTPA